MTVNLVFFCILKTLFNIYSKNIYIYKDKKRKEI